MPTRDRRSWRSSVQGFVEKRGHLRPDPARHFFVQGAERIVWAHERVTRARVYGEGDILAHCLQLRLQCLCGIWGEELIILGHVSTDRRREPRPINFFSFSRETV